MNYQDETEFKELLSMVKALIPLEHILEIGSMHGETLLQWMDAMPVARGKIISIDLMVPPSDPRYWAQKYGHEVAWHRKAYGEDIEFYCLDANSTDPRVVQFVRGEMPSIDFLFIDGGHDYGTCLSDWLNYGPLVRPGGIVAFHDLGREWPDVRKVWDVARQGKQSVELVQSPDHWGIGVLYV